MNDIKRELKDKARSTRGLVNGLVCDTDYIYTDANNFDLLCLGESLREAKETLQRLTDNLKELEYLLYLIKREDSRKDPSTL